MLSFSQILNEFADFLHTAEDPMSMMQYLDPVKANEMISRYQKMYDSAGNDIPGEDEEDSPTKSDVFVEWTRELYHLLPVIFMKQFSRCDAIALLQLFTKTHLAGIDLFRFGPDMLKYDIEDLIDGWNFSHKDEIPISLANHYDGDEHNV